VTGLNDRSRLRPFKASGTTHPTTKRRISKDLNTYQHRCENLKSYGLYITIFSKYQNILELQRTSVVIITSLCCFFFPKHRYAYEDKDPKCLPPRLSLSLTHTHTHTHSAHNVHFLTSANIKPLFDPQWRKLNMNILICFETSLITIDKIQIASGAQPMGKGMPYCSPTKW